MEVRGEMRRGEGGGFEGEGLEGGESMSEGAGSVLG